MVVVSQMGDILDEAAGPRVAVLRDFADERFVIQPVDLIKLGVCPGRLEAVRAEAHERRVAVEFRAGHARDPLTVRPDARGDCRKLNGTALSIPRPIYGVRPWVGTVCGSFRVPLSLKSMPPGSMSRARTGS
jgi:hypothetical protein